MSKIFINEAVKEYTIDFQDCLYGILEDEMENIEFLRGIEEKEECVIEYKYFEGAQCVAGLVIVGECVYTVTFEDVRYRLEVEEEKEEEEKEEEKTHANEGHLGDLIAKKMATMP